MHAFVCRFRFTTERKFRCALRHPVRVLTPYKSVCQHAAFVPHRPASTMLCRLSRLSSARVGRGFSRVAGATVRPSRLGLGLGMTACGSVAAVTAAVCAPAEPAPAAEKSELEKKDNDLLTLEEGPLRYAAYARRAVQVFLVKGRLVAYSSDVGESVRPVVPPSVVKFCYGITWAYVAVDVAFNGYEEQRKGGSPTQVARTVVHTSAFQVIASVLVPSVIIHQAVHMAQVGCQRLPPGNVAKWLPSLIGAPVASSFRPRCALSGCARACACACAYVA